MKKMVIKEIGSHFKSRVLSDFYKRMPIDVRANLTIKEHDKDEDGCALSYSTHVQLFMFDRDELKKNDLIVSNEAYEKLEDDLIDLAFIGLDPCFEKFHELCFYDQQLYSFAKNDTYGFMSNDMSRITVETIEKFFIKCASDIERMYTRYVLSYL